MFNFTDSRKTVSEIFKAFDNGELIVDDSYQRRSVWSEKDKVRLIETILLNLVIPQLFFWKAETDPETGVSTTHIVDGQQRIKAICDFVSNQFKLKKQHLLDSEIKQKYADKCFRDLDPEDRKSFWNYQLMIIDIDPNANRDDIITMFNRLNLTDYSLNDQEKRNSKSGEFAALARDISEDPVWEEKHLFTITDIKRMKDVEFCASLILLCRKGIIDQTDQTALNQAYEELQNDYKDAENDKAKILRALSLLPEFFVTDEIAKFLKKKTQLYTMFSVIFYMEREEINLNQSHKENLESFVRLYSLFNNDMDLGTDITEPEKTVFDWLKKYKLASSEGLNKHTNRMIRFNVLKDFLFNLNDELQKAEKSLYNKMEALSLPMVEDPEE